MRKALLFVAALLLTISIKAQTSKNLYTFDKIQNRLELDIAKIDLFGQRMHLLYTLNNDVRFNVSTSDRDGIFIIETSKVAGNINLERVFNSLLDEATSDFESMSKEEAGDLLYEWKSSLPDNFISSMMMDVYQKDRQNNLCANADPFCTDNGLYQFPAGVNAGNGESGPDYNCLSTRPNPAWYYMRMATAGAMTIYMYSTPSHDIDFCCWGPFEDPTSPCPNGLTGSKVVSCSYSPEATENCQIPASAQTGQYYILVITNYSNQQCNINFSKTAGTGTTDCSIINPLLSANTPCYGETLNLVAEVVEGGTYTWTSPDNQTHNGRTWTRSNATLNMAGVYTCSITAGTQSGSESINVTVLPRPTSDFTFPNQCIVGQDIQFTGAETTTPSGHTSQITSRSWNFGDGGSSTSANPTHTYTTPGNYSVTYTVTITGGQNGSCSDTKTKTVTIQSSMSANITGDNNICQNESTTLQANVYGGTGIYTYQWKKDGSPVGGNSSTLTQNMTAAGTFVYSCEISDGYTTQTPEFSVTVNELPTVDIEGPNHVNYGQSANLSVTPMSGASYHWTPANLIASGQGTASVTTVGLEADEPVTINLKITSAHGCENTGHITISLGDQFYAFVEVTGEAALCKNFSTTLQATASGGSGNYSYLWEPANLIESGQGTSAIETKGLSSTTSFTCTVSDGVYSMSDNKSVTVWQVEDVDYTPTDMQCNEYYWEAANETFTDLGDYPRTFYNNNGCEYTITLHLNDNNLKFTTEGEEPQERKDRCVNEDGYYIWSPSSAVDSYSIFMEYEGYEYHDSHEFLGVSGCPRIEYNWLKLYSQPSVDEELYGDTLVEAGFAYLPHVYEYNVQNLAGAGTEDDYPPTYTWSLFSYYDTPNHVSGTEDQSLWYILEDDTIKNKVYVYINSEGNALLKCEITTLCGSVSTEKFIWTEGYKYPGFSVGEINFDNMVNVFPNPSNGELYIGYSEYLATMPLIISIYSYDGALIDQFYSSTENNVTPYSMRDLANGLYLVKIVGKDFSVTKKFVLER